MTSSALPPPEVDFGKVFARSWDVFKRNWIVCLPVIIGGFVIGFAVIVYIGVLAATGIFAGVAAASSSHGSRAATGGFVGALVIGALILTLAAVLVGLWMQTGMYGMAEAAWSRGSTTLADAFSAFGRAGAVFVASIGIFLLAIVALILAIPTLTLSIFALSFATMYVLPAAVGGELGGFEAIGESFRLIRRFFVPSFVTWLVLYAIQYGISFLSYGAILPLEFSVMPTGSETTPHAPPIPILMFSGLMSLVTMVLLLAYTGFFAIAQVGMYRALRAQPDPDALYAPAPRPPILPQPPPQQQQQQ